MEKDFSYLDNVDFAQLQFSSRYGCRIPMFYVAKTVFLNEEPRLKDYVEFSGEEVREYLFSKICNLEKIKTSKSIESIRKFKLKPYLQTNINNTLIYGSKEEWPSIVKLATCQCDGPAIFINMPHHYTTHMLDASCGIYSFKVGEQISNQYKQWPITAIIHNYGFVVEMEKGYRSEISIIKSLFLDDSVTKEQEAGIRNVYRCDIYRA